jgi:hypothetical protein
MIAGKGCAPFVALPAFIFQIPTKSLSFLSLLCYIPIRKTTLEKGFGRKKESYFGMSGEERIRLV